MCSCEYAERPEVYDQQMVTARKAHRCCECRQTIAAGDRYERVRGLWEHRWDEYKTCLRCLSLRETMLEVEGCNCWEFGTLIQDCLDMELISYWSKEYGQE